MRLTMLTLLLALTVAFVGCGSDDGGTKEEGPGLTVAKGDCPDCDPAGPGAFEQADMGLRFYMGGDRWQMAYQFKLRDDMARETLRNADLPDDPTDFAMVQEERQVHVSDPFLFEYSVLKVDKRVIDNVQRDVCRIRVEQSETATAQFSQDRLDSHEYALEFEMDDLLRPVREIFYNRQYPHGKMVEVDKESSLSALDSGSNLYPHMVPRVLTTGDTVKGTDIAPLMTPEMEAIANELAAGWLNDDYTRYEFANGDVAFWAKGKLWPFYMNSQQGYGLLVGQTLMAR
jgi:hypothetical protein